MRRRRRSGVLVALLVGCAGRAAPAASPPSPEPTVATSMTPAPTVAFEDGPSIADPAALLAWLDTTKAGRRLVQLPVVVEFGPLGVQRAWIGNVAGAPADGAAMLKLDDTAMGVPLLDHLRRVCPTPTCAVWLEGTWGPVMEVGGMPALSLPGFAGPPRHDFAVRRLVGLADATATTARVQAK